MRTACKLLLVLAPTTFSVADAGQLSHPSFSITMNTTEKIVASGTEIRIRIVLQNTSDHEIWLARSPSPEQGQLHHNVVMLDGEGNKVPFKKSASKESKESKESQGNKEKEDWELIQSLPSTSVMFFKLKPGETLDDGIILTNAYDMTKPGKYTTQVERVDDESKAVVKSNTITVTVTP